MALSDTILARRSVRKYKNEAIPQDKLNLILQAALLAPTSKNRKPCEFIAVRNKELLEKLSRAKSGGSEMIAGCDTAIVVIADSEKADTWIEDSSIALSYMDLMAAEQGIGSCWCQIHLRFCADGRDAESVVRGILSLPEKYRIVGILSLGVPGEEREPHTLDEADFTKVRYMH